MIDAEDKEEWRWGRNWDGMRETKIEAKRSHEVPGASSSPSRTLGIKLVWLIVTGL
jgi:hypothetical protein